MSQSLAEINRSVRVVVDRLSPEFRANAHMASIILEYPSLSDLLRERMVEAIAEARKQAPGAFRDDPTAPATDASKRRRRKGAG